MLLNGINRIVKKKKLFQKNTNKIYINRMRVLLKQSNFMEIIKRKNNNQIYQWKNLLIKI